MQGSGTSPKKTAPTCPSRTEAGSARRTRLKHTRRKAAVAQPFELRMNVRGRESEPRWRLFRMRRAWLASMAANEVVETDHDALRPMGLM